MDGVRAANRFRASLGQTEKTHLAFAHQFLPRPEGFFNGRVGIDAMLIIKIDNFDIEPAQTPFARFANIIRFTANAAKLRLDWISQDSKLRRDDHLFAMTFNPATDQLFVRVWPVHVGGIEKGD